MELVFNKLFDKDLDQVKDRRLKQRIEKSLIQLEVADSLYAYHGNIKPLSGQLGYYRIRIGDYRLIFKEVDNRIELLHFRHRKDIYKDVL